MLDATVATMPFINSQDKDILELIKGYEAVFVIEEHFAYGGLGAFLKEGFDEDLSLNSRAGFGTQENANLNSKDGFKADTNSKLNSKDGFNTQENSSLNLNSQDNFKANSNLNSKDGFSIQANSNLNLNQQKIHQIALPNKFIHKVGNQGFLREYFGLNARGIVKRVKDINALFHSK